MSISDAKKPSKGRPAKDTEAVNVRLERALLQAVDDWRRDQPDVPTRPEAIRRLIQRQIKAQDEVSVAQIIAYCHAKRRSDLVQVIETLAAEVANPADADLPILYSFPSAP